MINSVRFLSLALFFLGSSFLYGQDNSSVIYEIEMDSIGVISDTMNYYSIRDCDQFFVVGTEPGGKRFNCQIVSGIIFVAGVAGDCKIDENGESYYEFLDGRISDDCMLLKQSVGRFVSIGIKYINKAGEEVSIGTSFKAIK